MLHHKKTEAMWESVMMTLCIARCRFLLGKILAFYNYSSQKFLGCMMMYFRTEPCLFKPPFYTTLFSNIAILSREKVKAILP